MTRLSDEFPGIDITKPITLVNRNRMGRQLVAELEKEIIDEELCRELITGGASLDITAERNMTPLMTAAWKGRLEIAALILDHGADINQQNIEGDTALKYAATTDRLDMAALLIDREADIALADKGEWTPRKWAEIRRLPEMTALLDSAPERQKIKRAQDRLENIDRLAHSGVDHALETPALPPIPKKPFTPTRGKSGGT